MVVSLDSVPALINILPAYPCAAKHFPNGKSNDEYTHSHNACRNYGIGLEPQQIGRYSQPDTEDNINELLVK